MTPTDHEQVNGVLNHLLDQTRIILGERLVGLYLYGSLVTGDFDLDISDIDLLAALTSNLTPAEFDVLDAMHKTTAAQFPEWDNRIEIAYLSLHALKTFKTERSNIGIISPGEPFHIIDAGIDWLMNWYMVQSIGKTLYGVPPQTIIAPTSQAEFVTAVKTHALAWREYIKGVDDSRPYQSYAILTLCRAWYTVTHGAQVSKRKAAEWAAEQLPEEAALIRDALAWRAAYRDQNVDPAVTLDETRRFVLAMIERIYAEKTYSD